MFLCQSGKKYTIDYNGASIPVEVRTDGGIRIYFNEVSGSKEFVHSPLSISKDLGKTVDWIPKSTREVLSIEPHGIDDERVVLIYQAPQRTGQEQQ